MNEKNLIPFNKLTESERRAIAKRAGKASARARAQKKTARELIRAYDGAPLTPEEDAAMEALGMPKSDRTAKLRRIIALIKRAEEGDVQANKLILETTGELRKEIVDNADGEDFVIRVEDCS